MPETARFRPSDKSVPGQPPGSGRSKFRYPHHRGDDARSRGNACATVDQQAAQLIQQAVAGFQDGQFQASFAAVAGDLSTAATEAATAFATSSVGSVIVINPNGSPRPTATTGGGGGVSALGQLTAGAASTTPNSTSPTAAVPVSATR